MKEASFSIVSLTKIHEHWGSDETEFLVQLHVEVSSKGTSGGEAFAVTVMSPAFLARELETGSQRLESARGTLFMLEYDERLVLQYLEQAVEGATSWAELSEKVRRHFEWIE